jgi:glucoamylase
MPPGKILRLILAAEAAVVWSADFWASTNQSETLNVKPLDLWFVDLPVKNALPGSMIEFTFFWRNDQRWEGRNYSVAVSAPN